MYQFKLTHYQRKGNLIFIKGPCKPHFMSILPVILSYNHPELTAKAVLSILNNPSFSNFEPSIPLILIHNGSEIKNIETLKKQFPQIDHFVLNSNKGFSGGANAGIKYAFENYRSSFSWVLFLTNDCELESWPLLSPDQAPGLIAPWIWARKTNRIDSIGGKINLITGTPSHIRTAEEFQNLINNPSDNVLPYIPGSAFLIHREVFYKLNGFNEIFGTYWEDIDLSLRALKNIIPLGEISSFKVRHKIGKTCHKLSHYTTFLYQRNRHWVSRYYVKGTGFRVILEFQLWKTWIRLSLKFLISGRSEDLIKLYKGIFQSNPL